MKLFNKIIFFLSLLYLGRVNAQDVSINILNQPASLYVGSTIGQVTIDICNNDVGTNNVPLNKLRPLISLPSSLIGTTLVSINNVGWQVLSNDGSTIRFENTATIAAGNCSHIILGYTAINPGGPLTITGTIGFNGPQTVGNFAGNDNGTTLMTVIVDTDKDGVPDITDLDDDNDGILDTIEYQACGIGGTAVCDTDGDGIPNHLDLDSDNDGINDVIETGGTDANKDGIADGIVSATGIPASAGTGSIPPDTDGDTRLNPYDLDSDNDGINDLVESGNPVLVDANGNGMVDGADPDGDGIVGTADGVPATRGDISDPTPVDTDGDGTPNYKDLDSDGDGLTDLAESGIPNPTTLDTNNDGKIDSTVDPDGDGIVSPVDGLPTIFGDANNPVLPDTDGDGKPDYVDPLDTSAKLILKVLLQGALLPTSSSGLITTGIMRDDLRTAGVIPRNEPYTALGTSNSRFTHVGGGGGEIISLGVLSTTGNDAIVDWVFVELRDANNPTQVIKTKSALVQRDGDVVESSDGTSSVTFTGVVGQRYYVSVKHRNHLGAMTATAILMTPTGTTIDFTSMTAAQTWNNTTQYNGFEQVDVNLKMALWAANTTADNKVKYVGVGNDQIPIFSQVLGYAGNTSQQYNYDFAIPIYLSGDVNMDAKVKYRGPNNDPAFIFYNMITKYGILSGASLYNYDLFLEQLP